MATISWINADAGVGIARIEVYRALEMLELEGLSTPYAVLGSTATEYTDPELLPGSVFCYQVKFVNTDGTTLLGKPCYGGWYTTTGSRSNAIINGSTELGLVWCGADHSIKLCSATLMAIFCSNSAPGVFREPNVPIAKQIFKNDPYYNTTQKVYKYMYKGRYYFACGALVSYEDTVSTAAISSLLSVMKNEILDNRLELTIGEHRYWARFPTLQEYEEIFKASFDTYNNQMVDPPTRSPLAGLCQKTIGSSTTTIVNYSLVGYASDTLAEYTASLQYSGHIMREWTNTPNDNKHIPLVWEPIL